MTSTDPLTGDDLFMGLKLNLEEIREKYSSPSEVKDTILNNGYHGINYDTDVFDALSTLESSYGYYDKVITASDATEAANDAFSSMIEQGAELFIKKNKDASIDLVKEITETTIQTKSMETIIIETIDDVPKNVYYEKATETIIYTEQIMSETTHIPIGKIAMGAVHANTFFEVVETLWEPSIAAWNSTSGAGDTLTPIKKYASTSISLTVGAAAGGFVGSAVSPVVTPAGGAVVGAGVFAAVFSATKAVVEFTWDSVEDLIDQNKALGKTWEETWQDILGVVETTIDDVYSLVGQAAEAAFDGTAAAYESMVDAIEDFALSVSTGSIFGSSGEDARDPESEGERDDSEGSNNTGSQVNDAMDLAEERSSPLILDLGENGTIDLLSVLDSRAYFDIDQDGYAENIGWVDETSGDGFLVFDRNSDGIVSDSGDLFGSTSDQGFGELALLDSNLDGLIDVYDADFAKLQLWVDANGNGYSEESELFSLSDYSIASISLSHARVDQTSADNMISDVGTFTYADSTTGNISDIWFSYNDWDSVYNNKYNLDLRSIFLPTLRGFGEVADLNIAISLDSSLFDDLNEMITDQGLVDLAGSATLFEDVRDIMHRWAGVDGVSSTSRGDYVDARDLVFLEKLTGQSFLQHGYREDPLWDAGQVLTEAFNDALIAIQARLLLQAGGAELFSNDITYDLASDTFTDPGAIDSTALSAIQTAATNAADALPIWQNVLRLVIGARGGEANLTGGDISALDAAIYASDNTLDFDAVRDSIFPSSIDGVETDGDASANTISGTSNDDILDGKEGNDTVTGGDGKDTLYGDDGDDTLTGGLDDDLIFGGEGDDTFVYNLGDGFDVYRESLESETGDKILFGSGITSTDLSFTRLSNNDLQIDINVTGNEGTIVIENQFNTTTSLGFIETIEFSDSSTLDLTAVNHTFTATDQKEILYGVNNGSGGIVDTIYGEGGNDQITGYFGADTLYGGDGDDTIYGGSQTITSTYSQETASNTLYGNDGNDYLQGSYGTDYLHGGAGNDTLIGNEGDDAYYFEINGGE
jgi:Ca2+-binding RTX toxin-like protein